MLLRTSRGTEYSSQGASAVHARPGFRVFWLLVAALLLPSVLWAQSTDGGFVMPTDVQIRGKGWSQLMDIAEISEFVLGLVEAMLLTAILAFHPKLAKHRVEQHDWQVPRTMFMFSLIGMLVGFLVSHHGYLIGFVVFGIGSLFRFRMDSMSTLSTAQVIFVSLVGLTVGVDLPAMALVATLGAWTVIWFFGRREYFVVEVKFAETASVQAAIENMKNALAKTGFDVVSVSKTKFKPLAEIVLTSAQPDARSKLLSELGNLQNLEASEIEDWHTE